LEYSTREKQDGFSQLEFFLKFQPQYVDRYYVGYFSDPWKRLEQDLTNSTDKYIGKAKDWQLCAVFEVSNSESEAIRLERFIKRQKSRKLIEQLCELDFVPSGHSIRCN
jgi:putative endonuclease